MFVDESGFRLNMTPSYAYAPKGERAYGSVPKNRGENTSLLAACSLDEGVFATMTLTGAVDGPAFEVYVQEVLCPKLRAGQGRCSGTGSTFTRTGEFGRPLKLKAAPCCFSPVTAPT